MQLTDELRIALTNLVSDLVESESLKKTVEAENSLMREACLKTLEENNLDNFEAITEKHDDGTYKTAKVTLVRGNTVTYNLEKLKQKFEKNELKRFVDTTYKINNVDEFKAMLEKYNVPNKEVKKYIEKEQVLREDKLKRLYEIGEVSVEQLAGCYDVKEKKPYIKLTMPKNV